MTRSRLRAVFSSSCRSSSVISGNVEDGDSLHAFGAAGLWFTGGSFSQCRIYSRFIALQIDAIEEGRLAKAA